VILHFAIVQGSRVSPAVASDNSTKMPYRRPPKSLKSLLAVALGGAGLGLKAAGGA